jgi:predicted DNA-binding ribbon-helix-helix protein
MMMFMRTTLTIDPDVFETARSLASQRGVSIGAVISELARQGLRGGARLEQATRNGIPLLPVSADTRVVTPELIASILDEE